MKKIKYFSALVLFSFSALIMRGQDIHFSQVNETPLFQSPANTGFFNGYVRAIGNYRNQWSAMNKAFQTAAISVDGGLFRSKKRPVFMGLGFTMFRDQAGAAALSTTSFLMNVSAIVRIGKKSALSAGFAGGAVGMNANYNKLTYESQFNGNYIDPSKASGEAIYRQSTSVDMGAGLAYEFATSKRDNDHDDVMSFRISLGAFHLNRPKQEFGPGSSYRLPTRYVAALTTVFDLEDTKVTLTPTFVYQMQGTAHVMMMGTFIKYRMSTGTKVTGSKTQNAMGFGLFYRTKDALSPQLIFDFGDTSIGLAYDVNLSGYRAASNYNGGFEISLRYNNLASSLFETKREFR